MHVRASILAIVCIATAASARPRRVTVLDFDGPRQLADHAHDAVVKILGTQYDLVPTRRWLAAKMAASDRGPMQWATAAASAGVDAVIEGWVDPDGDSTHPLTVAVREATTGQQIDTITVKIEHNELGSEQSHKLAIGLEELLSWVESDASDSGQVAPAPARLPIINAVASYPIGEPVIEVLLTGGYVSHHQGAVVWGNGTVQLFGPHCTQRSQLDPKRVAALIDALDQGGIFNAKSYPDLCADGLDVEVDVRKGDRRASARSTLCGPTDGSTARAYDLVWSALGSNSCIAAKNDGDDDDE